MKPRTWLLVALATVVLAGTCAEGGDNPEGTKCTELGSRKSVVTNGHTVVYECEWFDDKFHGEGMVWRRKNG